MRVEQFVMAYGVEQDRVRALLLTHAFGVDCRAIWLTTCITWTVTGAVGLLRYHGGRWRAKAIT